MGLKSACAGEVELSTGINRESDAGLPGFAPRGLKELIEPGSMNEEDARSTDEDGLNKERRGDAGQNVSGSERSDPDARMELMHPLLSS